MSRSEQKKLVRRWKRNWDSVAEFERAETLRLTPLDRLKQMAALMRMSAKCRMRPTYRADEIEKVRRRWVRLRATANRHEPA